jgi:hypothetical protein
MRKQSIFLILILLALFLNGCKYDFILPVETPPIDNGGEPISFATQIVPIFTDNSQAPMMSASAAYTQLMPAYVNTASPASSKLYVNAGSGSHYAKVSSTQAALILQWITEGAKNN